MENKNIFQRIKEGYYDCKVPYPDRKDPYFKQKRQDFEIEQNRLYDLFESDLIFDNGLTRHPKAKLLYRKAYEHGHSGGMTEIAICFADWAELFD